MADSLVLEKAQEMQYQNKQQKSSIDLEEKRKQLQSSLKLKKLMIKSTEKKHFDLKTEHPNIYIYNRHTINYLLNIYLLYVRLCMIVQYNLKQCEGNTAREIIITSSVVTN